jgi:hypothetical protein
MEPEPPIFSIQRLANGYWLVRAPTGDPILPAVTVAAVIEQTSAGCRDRANNRRAVG